MTSSSGKKWTAYMTRATELEGKFPLVAYYCRLYVLESLMKLRSTPAYDKTLDSILIDALSKCETAKTHLGSLTEGKSKMEEFCLTVFTNADNADRGSATQPPDISLANRFYASSLFFDVLTQLFEDGILPPDLEEKRRYAKFRTLQIRNREPLAVPPPPPVVVGADSSPHSAATVVVVSDEPGQITNALAECSSPSVLTVTAKSAVAASSSSFKYAEEKPSGSTSRPPTSPVASSNAKESLNPQSLSSAAPSISRSNATSAKKKLLQAISSIDFADYPTAVELVQDAMNLLR